MSRIFHARAMRAAVMIFAVLSGAQGSGAQAQTVPATVPTAVSAEPAPSATGVTFVAREIVQPLPQVAAAAAGTLAALVDSVVVDNTLTGEMRCLAEAVYFESRGEPLEGQLAVARVVINRANSGLYPADYCSVVTQPAQFSFVRRGVIPDADEGSAAWRRAMAIAQIAEEGLWECQARDALYFHATYVRPKWASAKTQLARIDTHIFYR